MLPMLVGRLLDILGYKDGRKGAPGRTLEHTPSCIVTHPTKFRSVSKVCADGWVFKLSLVASAHILHNPLQKCNIPYPARAAVRGGGWHPKRIFQRVWGRVKSRACARFFLAI